MRNKPGQALFLALVASLAFRIEAMAQAPERKLDKEIESLIQVFADPKATSIDNIQEAIKASNAFGRDWKARRPETH